MEFTAAVKAQLIALIDSVRAFVSGLNPSADVTALNARITELEAVVGDLSTQNQANLDKIAAVRALVA